jgi:hypothetical protein
VECTVCTHRWYQGEPAPALANPNFTEAEKLALFDAAPYVDRWAKKRRR